jgi:hypothetical protein
MQEGKENPISIAFGVERNSGMDCDDLTDMPARPGAILRGSPGVERTERQPTTKPAPAPLRRPVKREWWEPFSQNIGLKPQPFTPCQFQHDRAIRLDPSILPLPAMDSIWLLTVENRDRFEGA